MWPLIRVKKEKNRSLDLPRSTSREARHWGVSQALRRCIVASLRASEERLL
jgi:hypothetical protein